MKRQLEIGPSCERLPGDWVTVDCEPGPDVDHICRWGEERLPFPDASFDLVYAAHVLEHIPWYETVDALREAHRVLTAEGILELHVPDFSVLMRAAQTQCCPDDHAEHNYNTDLHWMHWVSERLFHMGPDNQWHKACFDEDHLRWCLEKAGFVDIQRLKDERGTDHGMVNLGMRAIKSPSHSKLVASIRGDKNSDGRNTAISCVGSNDGLPYCHSRREYDVNERVYFCAHPKVHAAAGLVTSALCARCEYPKQDPPATFRPYPNNAGVVRKGPCWHLGRQLGVRECPSCRGSVKLKVFQCTHTQHDHTTYADCLKCPDYDRRLELGMVRRWSVGVTTAPRTKSTLQRCLESLVRAGWDQIRLFTEPSVHVPLPFQHLPNSQRDRVLGAWSNWLLGMSELYERDPYADAYLMVQDDALFCRNVKTYLEHTLWPADRLACVTLYGSSSQGDGTFSCFGDQEILPGAVALVFPNPALRSLLSDEQVTLHRRRGPTAGTKHIDVAVRQWARRVQLPCFAVVPQLVDHIGETTSIWDEAEDSFSRRATGFVGENFDATHLIQETSAAPGVT